MALLILSSLIFLLPSCSDGIRKSVEIENYYRASFLLPSKLNPANSFSTIDNSICGITLEGLFEVNKFLEYVPVLVSSWSIDNSGKIYNFEIKKGVKFHNGIALTPQIVKSSLEKLITKESPVYNRYKRIKQIVLEGRYKFKIILDRPYPPFLALLSAPAAKIYLDPIKRKDSSFPIGTGAFYYKKKNDENLTFSRFEKYHSDRPHIKNLHYVMVDEKAARKGIATGLIHDTSLLPYLTNIKEGKKAIFVKNEAPSASTWIVAFNTSLGVTKSKDLRRCLIKSFSRKSFIMRFIPDHRPAKGFLPPSLFNKEIAEDKRNKIQCKKSFSGDLVLDIPAELEKSKEMCDFFKSKFNFIGINTKCNIISFDKLILNIRSGKSNAHFLAQTLDLPYVEYFLETFQKGSLINLSNYSSTTYDTNLEKLRLSSDRLERLKYIERLNLELYNNYVTLNISYPRQKSYWNNCLTGYDIPLFGEAYINYKNIKLKKYCSHREVFQ